MEATMLRSCSAFLTAAMAGAAFTASPAQAQALSGGDYEVCSVYRPNGEWAGYNNACLERQRAAIRQWSNVGTGQGGSYGGSSYGGYSSAPAGGYGYYGYPLMACPGWANNGYGFSTTTGSGGYAGFGPYDSAVNGRPCRPSVNIILPGIR